MAKDSSNPTILKLVLQGLAVTWKPDMDYLTQRQGAGATCSPGLEAGESVRKKELDRKGSSKGHGGAGRRIAVTKLNTDSSAKGLH